MDREKAEGAHTRWLAAGRGLMGDWEQKAIEWRRKVAELLEENKNLNDAVVRAYKASNEDLGRRRKAEHEVLALRDALNRQKEANNANCERLREAKAYYDGTNSDKWEPPSRTKMSRIYEERDKLKEELLRLADACIVRKVGKEWPAIEIAAKHVIEKYGDPEVNVKLEEEAHIDHKVMLALGQLKWDFDKIGAGGWSGRVLEIINLVTGAKA